MKKLIIVLVVLAVLFVAADRVLVSAAESVVARRVQAAAHLQAEPTVQIRGFPFLTQAVGGVYRRVDVSLTAVEREGMRLENVVVHLHGVHAPLGQLVRQDGSVTVRANAARAAAVVPYGVVEKRLPPGMDVKPHGDRLRLTGNIQALGRAVPASALVAVRTSERGLVFDVTKARVEGRTAPASLAEQFDFAVDVGELPFGVRVTGAAVTAQGVRLSAVGNDLDLTSSAAGAGIADRGAATAAAR